MNTKTTLKRICNYYNGSEHGVGRDSPGALLDMLAEVASQTLHSEKTWNEQIDDETSASKNNLAKSKNQGPSYNLSQLLVLPATQLVKQFSVFTSDELKRQYSYTCALLPECGKRYTSFASEGRARMSIKAHLAEHLEDLKNKPEAFSTFVTSAVKHRSIKITTPNKKLKTQQQKKPVETLNKENKESKSGKSTSYLRKILSNEMNFKEFEKQKTISKLAKNNESRILDIKTESEQLELQVLEDHTYYEPIKEEQEEKNVTSDLNEMMVNEAMTENIMLMVVESDGVHMKELPYIAHNISVGPEEHESEIIYLPESATWSDDTFPKNMEVSAPAKPKGKAKFIGTSKEEREMAIALMDRIKRKGNPTGENLQCRICDPPRSFTAPTTLVSHYRSHAGIKPYECRICRAVFTRRHSLKYHMLIHQNQTRFTCADCGKKFRHPSHFREHRRRHTGEAPFGCNDCGQRFKTRNTYKRHLKTRHGKVLTTNGELLHLSEEDFQKVKTNPKRRTESFCPRENMIDEDVIAADAIIEVQAEDNITNGIDDNYGEITNKETDGNANSELWGGDDVGDYELKEASYDDYEYFDQSEVNKTDYIETEINLENCKFENVDIDVNNLGYEEMVIENITGSSPNSDEEGTTADSPHVRIFRNENDEEDVFNAEQSFIGDESNHSNTEVEIIPYESCTDEITLENRSDYALQDIEIIREAKYFPDNVDLQNNVEYEETVEISHDKEETEHNAKQDYEHDDAVDVQYVSSSNEDIADDCRQHEEDRFETEAEHQIQSNELNIHQVGMHCTPNKITVVEKTPCGVKIRRNFTAEEHVSGSTSRSCARIETAKEKSKSYKDQISDTTGRIEDSSSSSSTHETQDNTSSHDNAPRIYLSANSTNNMIIKNKDLVDLLTRRIKLQENGDKLTFPRNAKVVTLLNKEPQSFNFVQNDKQGTILLLASNELTNNFLKIDATNVTAKGLKTLPVIAVQQK